MKNLMFLLIVTIMMASCKEPEINPTPVPPEYRIFTRSYVMGYFEHTGIDLHGLRVVHVNGEMRPSVELWLLKGDYVGTCLDEGEKKDAYDAICEKYGDMNYNDYVLVGGTGPQGNIPNLIDFPIVNITSINVVSNTAFDEQHPAGTSLNDIFHVNGFMAKNYIDNNYGRDGSNFRRTLNTHLDEVSPEEFVLTGDGASNRNSYSKWPWRFIYFDKSDTDTPATRIPPHFHHYGDIRRWPRIFRHLLNDISIDAWQPSTAKTRYCCCSIGLLLSSIHIE